MKANREDELQMIEGRKMQMASNKYSAVRFRMENLGLSSKDMSDVFAG